MQAGRHDSETAGICAGTAATPHDEAVLQVPIRKMLSKVGKIVSPGLDLQQHSHRALVYQAWWVPTCTKARAVYLICT